jgi:V8-like Glu-specific endopeptidase
MSFISRFAAFSVVVVSLVGCGSDGNVDVGTLSAAGQNDLIYGTDNRHQYYEITSATERRLADSTVSLIDDARITRAGAAYLIDTSRTYAASQNLCASEPYRDEPASAFCSGSLVAPDLVATAGHCIDAASCGKTTFAFGFRMESATTVRATLPTEDVYHCAAVVSRTYTPTNDFAVVRLDRPVVGRLPLPIRRGAALQLGAPLVVAGHPGGIPIKIANGAVVKDVSQLDFFQSNVDTYGGNSGSPVWGLASHAIEGILVRGNTDYTRVRTSRQVCYVSNVCSDAGCPSWEEITRIVNISPVVAAVAACASDAECDDGDPCNGNETCDLANTVCAPGTPISCEDGDACTIDTCLATSATTFACASSPDPTCGVHQCVARNAACSVNSDCCSGSCIAKKNVCR